MCSKGVSARRRDRGTRKLGEEDQTWEKVSVRSSSGDQHSMVQVALWASIIASQECFVEAVSTPRAARPRSASFW